jgi:hypothetical protein
MPSIFLFQSRAHDQKIYRDFCPFGRAIIPRLYPFVPNSQKKEAIGFLLPVGGAADMPRLLWPLVGEFCF